MRKITAPLHMHTNAQVTLLHFLFCLLRVDLPVFSAADWPDEYKRGPASVDHPTSDGHTSGCKFWRFNARLEEKNTQNLQLLDFLNWSNSWYLLTPHKSVHVFLTVALRFHSMGGASLWAYSPHIGNISRQIIGPTVTRKSWHIASTNQLFCQHIPLRNLSSSELVSVWQVLETKQC